ncbi:MAG TPA: glycosyltransferase, partial [Cellvibrionaceae bacterium]|nr:glycosyltransferase [Cellvibrionaceae bacterium]
MSPLISLVLCTYNNADSLKITLAQLAAQQLDQPHLVEFIVINNNSSDHTQAVIEAADFHAFNYQ